MATNKVVYGNEVLLDLTEDTVSADKLFLHETAHDKSGNQIEGTYNPYPTLQITNPPTKTTYYNGDTLDLTGIEVISVLSNGYSKNVTTECSYSPADGSIITYSDTKVTASYTYLGKSFSVDQNISVVRISSIFVETPPDKTNYVNGESLDLTGMVVKALWTDGAEEDVTSSIVTSPTEGTVLDDPTLTDFTISYTWSETGEVFTTSQAIEVKDVLLSITATNPTKTSYEQYENLDLTGCTVTANYASGKTEDVTSSAVFNPADGSKLSTSGNINISVTYTEDETSYSTTIPIVVTEYIAYTWSNGTDAQIKKMLDDHYAGKINVQNYWNVGDVRTVNLSSIAAVDNYIPGQSAQTVQFVLSEKGGKTLTTPLNGKTTCAFQVDQVNSLLTSSHFNKNTGRKDNKGGWRDIDLRSWCNNQYKNSIPSIFQSCFKQFKNKTTAGDKSTTIYETDDMFALRAQIEILGTYNYASVQEGSHITYYKTNANRIKKIGSTASNYWLRSPYIDGRTQFDYISTSGSIGARDYTYAYGIAPFGVI